jgi:hypothetical protein
VTIADMRTKLWWAPLAGGEPAAIPTDAPIEGRADALTVLDDKIAFSLIEGGVFTLPLEGGPVTPVEGAGRHHILRWPWVGTPGEYTPDNEPSFEEILNADTGETSRALVRPGERFVRCGVTTCAGTSGEGSYFYRLRDGSQERGLPQWAQRGLGLDRFMMVWLSPRGGQVLLDLATGKSGDLGLRPNAKGESISVQLGLDYNPLVSYELDGRQMIINLAKIR